MQRAPQRADAGAGEFRHRGYNTVTFTADGHSRLGGENGKGLEGRFFSSGRRMGVI
jgi:hypothetical protein